LDKALPRFVPPMLAVHGQPFDSEEHFFEFKWDGFRAGAMIEAGSVRLMSRKQQGPFSRIRGANPHSEPCLPASPLTGRSWPSAMAFLIST